MRPLLALLALLGFAGVVFGVILIIQGGRQEPFSFENYGGPGPIIGGLLLMSVSLYLLLNWDRFGSSSRDTHRK